MDYGRQDEAPLCSSGDLAVSVGSLRERDDVIDHRSLERALLENWSKRLEQRRRGHGVALARVDAEQLALVVIEVETSSARQA
jgi:hypothetical protein